MSNTRVKFAFALEYAKDIEATKRFCVDVLGLAIDREASNFVQFKDQNGASFCFGVKDPAGQVHCLLEFARQRPSQAVS